MKKAISCLVFTLILAATGAAFAGGYSSDYPAGRRTSMRTPTETSANIGVPNGPAPKVIEYPTGNRPRLGAAGWEFQGSGPWEGLAKAPDCREMATINLRCPK